MKPARQTSKQSARARVARQIAEGTAELRAGLGHGPYTTADEAIAALAQRGKGEYRRVSRGCTGWHQHFLAPGCRDVPSGRGRFDAVEAPSGVYVLDVGNRSVLSRHRSREAAVAEAQRVAASWRPAKARKRR